MQEYQPRDSVETEVELEMNAGESTEPKSIETVTVPGENTEASYIAAVSALLRGQNVELAYGDGPDKWITLDSEGNGALRSGDAATSVLEIKNWSIATDSVDADDVASIEQIGELLRYASEAGLSPDDEAFHEQISEFIELSKDGQD